MKISIFICCITLISIIGALRIKEVHNLTQVNNTNKRTNDTNMIKYKVENKRNETLNMTKHNQQNVYSIINDTIVIKKDLLDEKEYMLIIK